MKIKFNIILFYVTMVMHCLEVNILNNINSNNMDTNININRHINVNIFISEWFDPNDICISLYIVHGQKKFAFSDL